MENKKNSRPAPKFPKRAVVTNGMPYGDKDLHIGHIGGNFIHSDIYVRFLRDRIGKENVIYVSGTDCYGAGVEVKHQKQAEGTIAEFVRGFHETQKETLKSYGISLSLYSASALAPAAENHAKMSRDLFNAWYENGYLRLEEIELFYDEETETFLNGRQVEGNCPINGCQSEKGYADECALGHQYSPKELINPKSVITGKTPSLRPNQNWYFDLERFLEDLKERLAGLKSEGISRRFMLANIEDFLKDPAILISKADDLDILEKARKKMADHTADIKEEKKSATLTFKRLKHREAACEILREHGIRFRTGTTLTPFRLTGNVKWGITVPEKDGVNDQTFWVWPESLWAPMSFVQTYLEISGINDSWQNWWSHEDSRVYQFIGEDNIYFYAVASMGLFMALNEIEGKDKQFNLPVIIPNRHVFFGNNKASSSGKLQPPSADELLNFYTAEQLRMHFAHMALQNNSVKFFPKAIFQKWKNDGVSLPEGLGDIEGFDSTLAEGNLLTNVFNRLARSCFYSLQQYFEGVLPENAVSETALDTARKLIDDFEFAMYKFEFSKAIDLIDKYLRDVNKIFDGKMKQAKENHELREQTLADSFHGVRVCATLLHPFAPEGTERLNEYLNFGEKLWSWENIYREINFFAPKGHEFKFLEPKVDFFLKHPSQFI